MKKSYYERLAAFMFKMACDREKSGDTAAMNRFLDQAVEAERKAASL